MPSIEERREVAGLLRGMVGDTAGLSDGEFIDLVTKIVRGGDVPASGDPDAAFLPAWQDPDVAFLNRLADLIDPTEHERTVADNLALIERNRELGCELAACKAKLGRVFRIAARLRGDHRTAVLRAGDGTVPRSVADGFEIAEEIAATLQMTPRVTACEVGGAEWE